MKYCKKCGKEVNDEAVVCIHCGCSIGKPTTNTNSNSNNLAIRDNLILVSVIWMFLSKMYWKFSPILDDDWGGSLFFRISYPINSLIWALLPLGLAFAVLNKKNKVVVIVFGVIYLLYGLYEVVTYLATESYLWKYLPDSVLRNL